MPLLTPSPHVSRGEFEPNATSPERPNVVTIVAKPESTKVLFFDDRVDRGGNLVWM